MFTYNFKYEIKLLFRNRWVQFLTILLLLLFVFASYNGKQRVNKRMSDIEAAQTTVKTSDTETLATLEALEKGEDLGLSPWVTPQNPMNIGNMNARVVAMPANDMAFMATGQSDIYTHYIKPTVFGDDYALNVSEMSSPIQLLFGSFDLVFVVIYLLPLIIIAFSFNILSEERERGSLRLLASQPISIHKWVLQKLGIRLLWMILIIILVTVIVFLLNQIGSFSGFLLFVLACSVYMLFWFSLAFMVNIIIGKSAQNAFALLGFWIVLVLLVPSAINQLSDTLYPIPPRSYLVNEVRELKAEATKKQDEILDNFLRDHPEYASQNGEQSHSFWHNYMASQDLVKEQLQPLLSNYEKNLSLRHQWVDNLQWLSPAILVQQTLIDRAGTSKTEYENYWNQATQFSEEWKRYFMPLLYSDQTFTTSHFKQLPEFEYKIRKYDGISTRIWGVLVLITLVLGFTFLKYKLSKNRNEIIL